MTSVSQSQDLPQDLQAMMKSSHSGNSRQNSACTQSYLIATHWYVVNRLKDSRVQNHGAHSGTMHFSLLNLQSFLSVLLEHCHSLKSASL